MRDWDGIPNPLAGKTLRSVLESLVWPNWASPGYWRTRLFDDVLLRRDGGN